MKLKCKKEILKPWQQLATFNSESHEICFGYVPDVAEK